RKIIERRFHKDVSEQVKAELMLASLEQLADDYDIAPLSPPDIDPGSIEIPKTGPMVYEFEVEVRPQFDLPNYRGLKLRRPVRLPEVTHELLHEFGVHSEEQLRERIRVLLQRRLEYHQRQSARQQVLQHITAASSWELPNDLLARQARAALGRRIMEMRASGMSDDEIKARQRLLS